MSQVLYIKSAEILDKNVCIKILMIVLNYIQAGLLLIIIGYLITLDDLSRSIYLLCILVGKLSKTLIIIKKNSVVSWAVFLTNRHIRLLINYPLKMIRNRSGISVSVSVLKYNGCVVGKYLDICFAIYKRNSLNRLQLFVIYDYCRNLFIVADDLSSENDIDKLSCIHGAYIFRLKEFVVDDCKIIIYLALYDHVLHKVFHSRSVLMIYLHML